MAPELCHPRAVVTPSCSPEWTARSVNTRARPFPASLSDHLGVKAQRRGHEILLQDSGRVPSVPSPYSNAEAEVAGVLQKQHRTNLVRTKTDSGPLTTPWFGPFVSSRCLSNPESHCSGNPPFLLYSLVFDLSNKHNALLHRFFVPLPPNVTHVRSRFYCPVAKSCLVREHHFHPTFPSELWDALCVPCTLTRALCRKRVFKRRSAQWLAGSLQIWIS